MKKMSKAIEENKYKIAIKRLVSHSEKSATFGVTRYIQTKMKNKLDVM